MRYTLSVYIVSIVVIVVSVGLAWFLPVDAFFKGLTSLPAVGALCALLWQVLRDELTHQKNLELQRKEQLFSLGATSHMAKIVFDKHAQFCEDYMAEVHQTVATCIVEGPSKEVGAHADNLIRIRVKYAAWLSPKIASGLQPFETTVAKVGRLDSYAGKIGDDSKRSDVIEEMYQLFENLLKRDGTKKEVAAERVMEKVRDILGINEFTAIRKKLVKDMVEYVKAS